KSAACCRAVDQTTQSLKHSPACLAQWNPFSAEMPEGECLYQARVVFLCRIRNRDEVHARQTRRKTARCRRVHQGSRGNFQHSPVCESPCTALHREGAHSTLSQQDFPTSPHHGSFRGPMPFPCSRLHIRSVRAFA